jgi:SNF2 family DNA or RNA helicase
LIRTTLRPYQREAVDAALEHTGFAFFPEQRTGKCLISLTVVDHYKPEVLVIVCPKKAVLTWETELDLHLDVDWDCEIYIITYQEPVKNLKLRKTWYKWSSEFAKHGGTLMVIADEAHQIKKPGTAQSRFVRTLGKRAQYRLALTGTPIDKNYEQFWAVFDFIQHGSAFGATYDSFKGRYVIIEQKERRDGKQFPVVTGYQNTPELLEIIHRYSYRITFNEARIAMGKRPVRIHRHKKYFDLDTKSRQLYEEFKKDLEVTIEEMDITIDATLPITLIQKLQQVCGGFLLHQMRIPGQKKRKRLVVPLDGREKLNCMMGVLSGLGDEKVVICARFTHEVAAIRETLDEFNWTHKEISGQSEWDGEFDKDVVVLQVKSGLGFDLSESNTYIFYSWDHSYITFEQARFRIMNMEHTTKVNYYFLLARDTIEEEYYEAIKRKKDFSQVVLDRHRRGTEKDTRRVRKTRKRKVA